MSTVVVSSTPHSHKIVASQIATTLNTKWLLFITPEHLSKNNVILVAGLTPDGLQIINRLKTVIKTRNLIVYIILEGPPILSYKGQLKKILGLADTIIAPSNFIKENIELLDIQVTEVIPHQVDPDMYIKPKKHTNHNIGYIAGYMNRKYPDYFFNTYCDKLKTIDSRVITNPQNPYTKCFSKPDPNAYKLPKEKIVGFYDSLGFYVNFSDNEGFGMTPLEAQATGTPVIAPKIPPLTETLKKGVIWVEWTGKTWYEPFTYFNIQHHIYDPHDMMRKIEEALQMTDKEYERLSTEAYENSLEYRDTYQRFKKYLT